MIKDFRQAAFLLSATDMRHFPADEGGEVAFVGRSNAGKSSAINALTGRRALARTSKTPGRTQHINFFGLDGHHRLVDLPGYGYAKVPPRMKAHWERLIDDYLRRRMSLRGLVIVVDARRALSGFDRQILGWCQAAGVPAHVLLTKSDKLTRNGAMKVLREVQGELQALAEQGEDTVEMSVQLFSATQKSGVADLESHLLVWLQ